MLKVKKVDESDKRKKEKKNISKFSLFSSVLEIIELFGFEDLPEPFKILRAILGHFNQRLEPK